jgi:hypothetical protein
MLPAGDIDLIFGLGFVPDWVKMYSMAVNEQYAHWSIHMMRDASALEGMGADDDGTIEVDLFEKGIAPYRGGIAVTAAQASAGNCLAWDKLDYSKAVNHDPGTYEDISTWTFVTGQTGYWDKGCNTTYIGVGSIIWIASGSEAAKRYVIAAMSSDGDASADVTLSEANVYNGTITKISGMYYMKTMSAGKILPAGFRLDSEATFLLATSEQAYFEAGAYDN